MKFRKSFLGNNFLKYHIKHKSKKKRKKKESEQQQKKIVMQQKAFCAKLIKWAQCSNSSIISFLPGSLYTLPDK